MKDSDPSTFNTGVTELLTEMNFCQISKMYLIEEALSSTNSEQAYEKFKELYSEVVNNHAPLKQRVIRGNQAPFMSKDLSKQIMIRSRLRNKFNRHKTSQNWNAYKAQ